MSLGDFLPGGKNGLTNVMGDVAKVGAVYSALFPKKPKPDPAAEGDFTLSKFTAELNADARRIAKGYHYVVHFEMSNFAVPNLRKKLTFNCTKATVPGWQVKTQAGKIYGLEYEIATGIEQDPVWLTFNLDIRHQIDALFLDTMKKASFEVLTDKTYLNGSYSPKYKQSYQFKVILEVTDENFKTIHQYELENSMVKTVQQVQLGSGDTEVASITVQLVYETINMYDFSANVNRQVAPPQKSAKDRNKLKLGPFQADISGVNQVVDGFGKVPDWFSSPDKI